MSLSLPSPSLLFIIHQHTDQAHDQRKVQTTGVLTQPVKDQQPVHHSFIIYTCSTVLLLDILVDTFSLFVLVSFHGRSVSRLQSGLYPETDTPQLFRSSFQEAFEGVLRTEQVVRTHIWISVQHVLNPLFENGQFWLRRKRKPDVLEFFTSSHS